VWLQRSALHLKMGNPDKAAADWERAKKLDPALRLQDRPSFPDPPKPVERKKLTAEEKGRLAAVLAAAQKAWDQDRLEACRTALNEALQIDPTAAAVRTLRARLLGQTLLHQESIDEAAEAIRLDPTDAWAYTARGWARNQLKDHAGAIADYTIALRLDPKNYSTWNQRGRAYYLRGQYHQALADVSESLRLNPGYSMALQNRGASYLHFAEYDKALADYLKVAEARSANTQLRLICAAI
jgi:tetratricopeptide (TPR) repeat protein